MSRSRLIAAGSVIAALGLLAAPAASDPADRTTSAPPTTALSTTARATATTAPPTTTARPTTTVGAGATTSTTLAGTSPTTAPPTTAPGGEPTPGTGTDPAAGDPSSTTVPETTLPPVTFVEPLPPEDVPLPEGGDGDEGPPPEPEPIPGFVGGSVRGDASIAQLPDGRWETPILIAGPDATVELLNAALEARRVADAFAATATAADATADAAELEAASAQLALAGAQTRLDLARTLMATTRARTKATGAALYVGVDRAFNGELGAALAGDTTTDAGAATAYARAAMRRAGSDLRSVESALARAEADVTTRRAARDAALAAAADARAEAVRAAEEARRTDTFAGQLEGRDRNAMLAGNQGLIELQLLAGHDRLAFPFAGPYGFSDTWLAPRDGGARLHKGTDILGASGIPLVAIEDGVVRLGQNRLGGLTVWLFGVSGNRYYYAHLSSYREGLVTGATVRAGEVLAFNGDTGNARFSVPHLHFEVHPLGGEAVNPYPLLRALAEADRAARETGRLPSTPPPVAPADATAPADPALDVPALDGPKRGTPPSG